MSRSTLRLILLAFAGFLAVLIARLPAAWIAPLLPTTLTCASWSGSLWRGQCDGVTVQLSPAQVVSADLLQWQLRPASLLRARVQGDVRVARGADAFTARVHAGPGSVLSVSHLTGRMAVDRNLLPALPSGWQAQVATDSLDLELRDSRLARLRGTASLLDIRDTNAVPLGSYELSFTDSPPEGPYSGALRDLGGPLGVAGTVKLQSGGAWQIDGRVAPRADAPAGLLRQVQMLGLPDAAGSYPFSLAGE